MTSVTTSSASASSGSGDYAIGFSTARTVRRAWDAERLTTTELSNEHASGLFQAVIEATEEAIYNSLFTATTVEGNGAKVEAIPLDKVVEVLRKYGIGSAR